MFAPLLLLLAAQTATAARPPKKFAAAQEVRLDGSTIKAMGDQLFCVAPPEKPAVTLLFSSVTWDITFDPEARRSRARAASDDDFHEAGASLVAKLVGADRGSLSKELDEKLARRPLFPMPWDSCPNPFSDCVLDLSPFGNSCARVSSSQPYEVRAVLDRGMPVRRRVEPLEPRRRRDATRTIHVAAAASPRRVADDPRRGRGVAATRRHRSAP